MSVHSPRRLHFEHLKLLKFDFNADLDPDPAFRSNPDPYPASKNNADPDPSPCTYYRVGIGTYVLHIVLRYGRDDSLHNCHGPFFCIPGHSIPVL